jgi:hypothetical protein
VFGISFTSLSDFVAFMVAVSTALSVAVFGKAALSSSLQVTTRPCSVSNQKRALFEFASRVVFPAISNEVVGQRVADVSAEKS